MTAAVETCTVERARELTKRITVALDAAWDLIAEAWKLRVWAPLGYSSWDKYVKAEFSATRLRLPREERQEVVASLRELGMSTRAIASALGVSQQTVNRDRAESPTDSFESVGERPVTGVNGKHYAPTHPRPGPAPVPEINTPTAQPTCTPIPKEHADVVSAIENWATEGVAIIDKGLNEAEQFIMARTIRALTDHLSSTKGI